MTLVARGQHLAAMQANGVRVIGDGEEFIAHPVCTDDLSVVSTADVVFLTVKAHALTDLAPRLGPLLGPETAVVTAQNGIPWWYFDRSGAGPLAGTRLHSADPGSAIAESIETRRVIGCVVYPATQLVAPGVIEHLEGTRFSIGEPDGSKTPRCQAIAAALIRAGLKCPIRTRIPPRPVAQTARQRGLQPDQRADPRDPRRHRHAPRDARGGASRHGGSRQRRARARRRAGDRRRPAPGRRRKGRRPQDVHAPGRRDPSARWRWKPCWAPSSKSAPCSAWTSPTCAPSTRAPSFSIKPFASEGRAGSLSPRSPKKHGSESGQPNRCTAGCAILERSRGSEKVPRCEFWRWSSLAARANGCSRSRPIGPSRRSLSAGRTG